MIGPALIRFALEAAAEIHRTAPLAGVEVVAKSADTERFYRRYGFEPLSKRSGHMYLPIATVLQVVE